MKILFVEDDVVTANFLMRGLQYEGYTVEHALDGREGLDRIIHGSYDCVILDLMLPHMSGEDVLKQVRAQKKSVPIIILTAIQDAETKIKLLNAGADDYLLKPFSFVELIARVKAVVRRTNGEKSDDEILEVDDLKMIPRLHKVVRGEKTIKLRLKEYALLEYLMRHPEEVVTRGALIEKVWDYNAKIFSNTVDSHISILRKKINDGFDKKYIETIHGVGYILDDQ
ncbi:response regulator transcription factor [Patescibacteria group bacterium]